MASAGDVLTFQANNQAPSYQASSGGVQHGLFEGYAIWTTTTTIELTYGVGDLIEIAGEMVDIDGLVDRFVTTADTLLTALGGNSGNIMAPDTTYYLYVSNSVPAYSPLTIRASNIPPARDPSSGGILYLDPTGAGDGRYWRYVGIVRAYNNGTGNAEFRDNENDRGLANYYNRRRKPLFVCRNYVNDNVETTFTGAITAGGVWTPLMAVTFVAHALGAGDYDNGVFAGCRAKWTSATNNVQVGLTDVAGNIIGACGLPGVGEGADVCVPRTMVPVATAFNGITMWGVRYTGAADDVIFTADAKRNALAADLPVTYIFGDIFG